MLPRRTLLIMIAAATLSGATSAAQADQPWFNAPGGVALQGYDPVAYFMDGRPVEGQRQHAVMWKGAIWYFASASNRDSFEMNPKAYAPQYGGYCAYAVSRGYTAKIDPRAWRIVDGKLYLNYSRSVRTLWAADVPGNIRKANANWPAVLSQ